MTKGFFTSTKYSLLQFTPVSSYLASIVLVSRCSRYVCICMCIAHHPFHLPHSTYHTSSIHPHLLHPSIFSTKGLTQRSNPKIRLNIFRPSQLSTSPLSLSQHHCSFHASFHSACLHNMLSALSLSLGWRLNAKILQTSTSCTHTKCAMRVPLGAC